GLARPPAAPPRLHGTGLVAKSRQPASPEMHELAGGYLADVRQLGRRTAELHHALANVQDPAFAPEPFSAMHAQSIFQWSHVLLARTFELLATKRAELTAQARAYADQLLPQERTIERRLRRVTRRRIPVQRIRCHGDLHLGQVLYTGQDFVIIDLEGEPGRSISQRRYKRGPLRDVMGMIRSFGYATENVLRSGRRSEEHTSELQSRENLVCRLLLE